MAAGKRKLEAISQIVKPQTGEFTSQNEQPRSAKLRRDERLIARYYYYAVINKKTINDVLEALETEFNLGTDYISDLLAANITAIKELRNKNPKKQWFARKWPYLKW